MCASVWGESVVAGRTAWPWHARPGMPLEHILAPLLFPSLKMPVKQAEGPAGSVLGVLDKVYTSVKRLYFLPTATCRGTLGLRMAAVNHFQPCPH